MIVLVPAAGRAHADPVYPRVRPLGPRTALLLARGRQESPTLAALVASLDRSDVIVHVQVRHGCLGRAQGATRLVAHSGAVRYLRIVIDASVTDESAIALLGHELHHASEIAQAAWVIDEAALVRLYARIGHIHQHDGAMRADSPGARNAGMKVLTEVRQTVARRRSVER